MKKSKIENIKAREILDSRGNPTVEVDLITDKGLFKASVPSGASKGKYEARELRDGGKRYQGMGVLKAIKNVDEIIAPKLEGKDVTRQKEIDDLMIKLDGTENKSKLGSNAILPVSLAVCRAGAAAKNIPLYEYIAQKYIAQIYRGRVSVKLPMAGFNIINGGVHAGNGLDFQEFMIVPQENSFSENLRIATEIYHKLKELLSQKFGEKATNLGDEGGFAPPLRFPEEALEFILKAAQELNYEGKIKFILDVAASQFFEKGKYKMKLGVFTGEGLMRYYENLIKEYPILGIEDPFAEDDWKNWQMANSKGQMANFLIIGDDLTATNPKRIKLAKEKSACNGMIVKMSQIGTVSETIIAAKLAKSYDWKIIVSHRSGETNDDFISDLALGIGADFIKAGAPARGERVAKYNRLLRIEENSR
jgi:enolase